MSDDKKDNILDFVKAKKREKEKLGRGARQALEAYKNYPGPTATPIAFEMAIVVHGKKNDYLLPVSTINDIINGDLCFTDLDKDWEDVLQPILKDWLKYKQSEFKQPTE